MANGDSKYAESSILTGLRDIVRLVILAMILWTANTLNKVDKDTSNLIWRMQRIESRVGLLESQERDRIKERSDERNPR